ncbi:MAG: cytochrome P450 [Alphaproteobacteria bacterium]|nr:cytochrome P450 [Alphaproteobacteria bacterium]
MEASAAPIPVMPARPAEPLPTREFFKAVASNSLTACDEELFNELIVPRRYLWQRVFFVSDPEGIRRVFLDNVGNYPRYRHIRRLFQAGLGTGTLGTEGELWARHRRISAPSLDPRAIAPDVPAMIALAEDLVGQLDEVDGDGIVDVEAVIGIVLIALWNQVVTAGDPEAEPMLRGLSKYPRKPRFVDFTPLGQLIDPFRPANQRRQKVAAFDDLLFRLIDERISDDYPGPHDLVWRLIHLSDRKTGDHLSREEVRDEAASVIAGGVSPTIRALTWIWYLLALHPEAEARLHAELDTVLQGKPPTPVQLPLLPYTRRVIDETMRLYPPIPGIIREAAAEDTVCGYHIPPRSVMAIMPWVVHRHRKLWDDPDCFDPDRFTPERSTGRSRFAYVPFAAGPRICVGASFAMTQMLAVMAVLARRYRFRLVPEHPVRPVGRISLHPFGGLKMRVEPR